MRLIYDQIPVVFETNGDCSAITLNFPEGAEGLVAELRQKLADQGFYIVTREFGGVNDNQIRIRSSALASFIGIALEKAEEKEVVRVILDKGETAGN